MKCQVYEGSPILIPNKYTVLFHWLKLHFHCKMKKEFSYILECKMWTVYIRDSTARSLQSDLNLHCL